MEVLAGLLALAWLGTAAYLALVLAQVRRVRRELRQQRQQDRHEPSTLALVVPALEGLTAEVNAAVRRAGEATSRSRAEERRIRSFIADISHDLRTPLTSIRGYLQLLERSELTAEQRQKVQVAHEQARAMGALVDRLYEYAYLLDSAPDLAVASVDASVLVGECLLGMTAPIEAAGLEVQVSAPASLPLTTDREKLTRIVQNLLRNAVQHGRGTLHVSLEPGVPGGGGLLLQVSNGVPMGIDVDPAALFERFRTTGGTRAGRSSGLGLAIVKALVEQLGGTVTGTLSAASLSAASHSAASRDPASGSEPPSALILTITVALPDL